jgi:hypothetical protein
MAIGRAERFRERKPRVVGVFGDDTRTLETVSEVLVLLELAWHDCYDEITPPEAIVDDVLLCSEGTLPGLIRAAHLAVVDRRDLDVWASDLRRRSGR